MLTITWLLGSAFALFMYRMSCIPMIMAPSIAMNKLGILVMSLLSEARVQFSSALQSFESKNCQNSLDGSGTGNTS